MSFPHGEGHPHEIIIVRHAHGDHDEGHHGGVWKIAFADFMTAMMCFFLVMWLINAANEQTKAAVASYFNPVKLVDRNSSKKGLEDLGEGPHSAGQSDQDPSQAETKGAAEGEGGTGSAEESTSQSTSSEAQKETNLFANPYAVLAEIAEESGTMQNISEKGDGGAQMSGPASGASGGEAYRDPFAPDFWSQQVAANDTAGGGSGKIAGKGDSDGKVAGQTQANAAASDEAVESAETAKPDAKVAAQEPAARTMSATAEAKEAEEQKTAEAKKPEEKKAEDHKPSEKALATAAEIQKELAEAFSPGEKIADGISVVATDKGVTISVTDQLDFGMFEIGSALPRRDTVLAMEKIAHTLSGQKGALTIGGHTDGRPFRSETYDNWRLSTARAHSAYYMLVRAGIDERRVTEVAGYADRKLREAADPLAAANRRIEILLEIDG